MENLREQIFQATSNFVAAVQQLTEQHTAQVLQETFSSLGGSKQRATSSTAATVATGASRSRGAKRGPDELEHLSKCFVQFVQDNPGLRIEQINKQLGTTTTELALPIRKLVSSGDITVKGQKRSTTYFAGKKAASPAVASEGKTAGKKSSRSKKSRTGRSKSGRSRSKKK